ncbi:10250_t:CDS:1, partial [Ambispora leptoticha]
EYILLKPQTYMNNSGECIAAFLNYFRIPLDDLLVIYDEIALPWGKFRYRGQGSSGGHNGMKNIIKLLGSKDFKRLRVGIGYDRNFLIRDWVLRNFSQSEREEIRKIMPNLLDGLLE